MKNWKIGFVNGVIYATALLINTYDEGAAETLWGESGYGKEDLKNAEKNDAITVYNYFYAKKDI